MNHSLNVLNVTIAGKRTDSETVPASAQTPVIRHRDRAVEDITSLLTCHVPFIFITGPPHSGKSYCLEHIVKSEQDNLNIGT